MKDRPRQPEQSVPLAAVTLNLHLGGSSTFLLNLAKAFHQRGLCLPVIVLSEEDQLGAELRAANVPVTIIPRRPIYEDRLQLTYQALARWQPKAVLASLGAASFEVLRLVPPGTLRLGMIQSHDPGPYGVVRQYAPWQDAIVGVSRTICQDLQNYSETKAKRAEYIPYGISFGPARFRPETQRDQPIRLVYVGRLIEVQKRVSRLAELVHTLRKMGVMFRLTLVGSGPDQPALQSQLQGFREVEFLGDVPNDRVSALLNEQDVFVLLSDFEGLPLSLLEAMGAGAVPVVSDVESGIRDVVTPDCGIRVPIGDVNAAAAAIATLSADRAKLSAMSRSAVRVREEYSAERMAERYLQLCAGINGASWPAQTQIKPPLGLNPWVHSGALRVARRWIKRLVVGRPESSSQS